MRAITSKYPLCFFNYFNSTCVRYTTVFTYKMISKTPLVPFINIMYDIPFFYHKLKSKNFDTKRGLSKEKSSK